VPALQRAQRRQRSASLTTRADATATNDHHRSKSWTSYAHLATWGILLARTSNEGAPQKGISYFICR